MVMRFSGRLSNHLSSRSQEPSRECGLSDPPGSDRSGDPTELGSYGVNVGEGIFLVAARTS